MNVVPAEQQTRNIQADFVANSGPAVFILSSNRKKHGKELLYLLGRKLVQIVTNLATHNRSAIRPLAKCVSTEEHIRVIRFLKQLCSDLPPLRLFLKILQPRVGRLLDCPVSRGVQQLRITPTLKKARQLLALRLPNYQIAWAF